MWKTWRRAVQEVGRVLEPGGRFYGEDLFGPFITHSFVRHLLRHPEFDRFRSREFQMALSEAGLLPETPVVFRDSFGWFTATKLN